MHLTTCTGCKFKGDCDHATHLRAALKGHGIRSIKFACAKRDPVFRPGDPAIFTTYTATGGDNDETTEVRYPGVVISQKGGKVFGFIRPGIDDLGGEGLPFIPRSSGYVKMPIARVRPDPSRSPTEIVTCPWCASNYSVDGICHRDPNYTRPDQCLKHKADAAA